MSGMRERVRGALDVGAQAHMLAMGLWRPANGPAPQIRDYQAAAVLAVVADVDEIAGVLWGHDRTGAMMTWREAVAEAADWPDGSAAYSVGVYRARAEAVVAHLLEPTS